MYNTISESLLLYECQDSKVVDGCKTLYAIDNQDWQHKVRVYYHGYVTKCLHASSWTWNGKRWRVAMVIHSKWARV